MNNHHYETLFKERDSDYYEQVKDIVRQMPDIRRFESQIAREQIGEWNDEKRWKALLEDFETLDQASSRGDQSDIDIIKLINLLGETTENFNELKARKRKITPLEDKIIDHDLIKFVETYPALSWVSAVSNIEFRPYIVNIGYIDWIDDVKLTDSEILKLLSPLGNNQRAIDKLLKQLDIETNKYPLERLIIDAVNTNKLALVKVLLEKNVYLSVEQFIKLLYLADFELAKLAYEKGKYDIYTLKYEPISDIKDTRMIKYLISKGLVLKNNSRNSFKYAIDKNDLERVKLLVEAGVNIFDNRPSVNPFYLAISFDRLEILKYLLSISASAKNSVFEHRDNDIGGGPTNLFRIAGRSPNVLNYLLNTFNNDISDQDYYFSLQDAIYFRRLESARILLERHEFTPEELNNLISYAEQRNYTEDIIKLLETYL